MQDRSWAIGLTQEQFEIEFMRRNMHPDVIPVGVEWVEGSDPEPRGISVPPVLDEPGPPLVGEELIEKKTSKKRLGYPCRGCGRVFDYPVARAGHERRCKSKIEKEIA